MLSSFLRSILLLTPIALLTPVVDDPPLTIIECGASDTVTPAPGTTVTGVGATYAEARADLGSKLGLVCSVCAGVGCELSVGTPGNIKHDIYRGMGGTVALGRDPGGPYLITVHFGTGGHCKGSCSTCEDPQ